MLNMDGRYHRPNSRQVTGGRCTGGRGSPVMSWIPLKANNAQQASGAIKYFSVLSEMYSICEQPLYGIMLMILHTIKWCVLISDQNLQIFFKSIWKIPSASGHSHSPFTSCPTRPSWHNGSWLGPHVLNGYGSMTLATTNIIYGKRDPALVDMWGTSYQKYEVPVFIAQTRNHWRKWKGCASVFGTLAQPFHFLPNTPVMTQWILTGPARVEWLWVNDFSHNEYHIWQAWPSTCWHVGNKLPKIWSTSLHCADA